MKITFRNDNDVSALAVALRRQRDFIADTYQYSKAKTDWLNSLDYLIEQTKQVSDADEESVVRWESNVATRRCHNCKGQATSGYMSVFAKDGKSHFVCDECGELARERDIERRAGY